MISTTFLDNPINQVLVFLGCPGLIDSPNSRRHKVQRLIPNALAQARTDEIHDI
jgi:hypothetical protein